MPTTHEPTIKTRPSATTSTEQPARSPLIRAAGEPATPPAGEPGRLTRPGALFTTSRAAARVVAARRRPADCRADPGALVRAGDPGHRRARAGHGRRPSRDRAASGTVVGRCPAVRGPRLGRHGRSPSTRRARSIEPAPLHRTPAPARRSGQQPAGHHRRVVRDDRCRRRRSARPSCASRPTATSTPRPGVIPSTGVGSGVIYDSERLDPDEPPRRRGQRHAVGRAQRRPRVQRHGLRHRHAHRPGHRQGRGTSLPAASDRRLDGAQGRPARRRHRQPARDLLELGHERHRLGQGPLDHDRRQPEPQQPHPDRRRHQPRQLRRAAARRRAANVVGINTAIAADCERHRLRDPDRHRPADHGPGRRRQEARPAVHGRRLRADRPPVRVGRRTCRSTTARSSSRRRRSGAPSRPSSPGSPADKAGIQDGDIIVKVNDQAIDGDHPLDATLSEYAPGDTVTIQVLRDGQTLSVQLTLGTRPADSARPRRSEG